MFIIWRSLWFLRDLDKHLTSLEIILQCSSLGTWQLLTYLSLVVAHTFHPRGRTQGPYFRWSATSVHDILSIVLIISPSQYFLRILLVRACILLISHQTEGTRKSWHAVYSCSCWLLKRGEAYALSMGFDIRYSDGVVILVDQLLINCVCASCFAKPLLPKISRIQGTDYHEASKSYIPISANDIQFCK